MNNSFALNICRSYTLEISTFFLSFVTTVVVFISLLKLFTDVYRKISLNFTLEGSNQSKSIISTVKKSGLDKFFFWNVF